MTPDRLQQIEALYHSARECSGEQRVALLASADPELRGEVESLLANPGESLPPLDVGDLTVKQSSTRLGPYQVESKLGQGGMGEVFRAVDTRLGRPVAIKVVDQEFIARFQREARAISSLNHPHICTLYDVGPNYLVMELLEGETIAARLKDGPIKADEALRFATQIASALTDAHEHGIVHRDLKPGNIMLTKSGTKVLDFGLATWEGDETLTASRVVMGTPAYMAPEQREGRPSDARTDIYSFGRVFYEMLTGGRPAAERKPLPSKPLEAIVARCLEADPARRWQSTAELARALEAANTSHANTIHKWFIPAAAIFAIALVSGYFLLRPVGKLTDRDTIVLADFTNTTGDPVFDGTMRQGLAIQLEQSKFLGLLPDRKIQQTLRLMGQAADARITPALAQQICERTGSAAVLEGSVENLGSQYVLGLRAKNCRTGGVLANEQAQASKKEEVLNALSQIAVKFRSRVGESLATVESHSTPLAEMTTPSLEALRAYSTGLRLDLSSGHVPAIPFLRRAVEIDPKFAVAHAHLGLAYSNIGESVLSAQSTTTAWQLRDRASDRERFFIDFNYYRQVTGNLDKAFQTLESWAQTFPREAQPDPRGLMGGLSAVGTGRFEIVIEQGKKLIASEPDIVHGYGSVVIGNFSLDRFGEAGDALRQASARKLEAPIFAIYRYIIAFLKGDQAQMDQVAALAKGKRGLEHWMTHSRAMVMARSGRLQEARALSSQAMDRAKQEGTLEGAATYQATAAVWEALYGNAAEARKSATAALALSSGRDVEYAAALALALTGELSRSDAVAGDLEKRFPEDTFSKFTYVPVLRALSSLNRGRPADSIEQLQSALPYEFAVNGLTRNLYLGGMHSAYVRGEALMAAQRYAEAAAEFQKVLAHRGVVGADPIGALAHLKLGRAFSLSGDDTKAKAAYQEFLGLWNHADEGIPMLQQAKAEYAKPPSQRPARN